MAIRKQESCRAVIKFCAKPTVKRMARLAGSGKLRAGVVWIRRLLIIIQVTGSTGRGESLELADGRALVAIIALHGRMRPEERKPILVIVDLLYGNLPALNGVTLRAVRSHFSLMNIGVTILTSFAHVSEYRLGVAPRAGHLLMQTPQRVLGLVVVEFRNGSDGTPSCGGMAIFAGNCQRSVRTSGGLPLRGRHRCPCWLPSEKEQPTQDSEHSERICPLPRSVPVG